MAVSAACGSSDSSSTGPTGTSTGSSTGTGSGTGGTGGSKGDAGSAVPPIDPNKMAVDLTDAEKGELCDWMAALWGGYGHETPCSSGFGSVAMYKDQATCKGEFTPNCVMTVAEFEMCQMAYLPLDACITPDAPCRGWRTC